MARLSNKIELNWATKDEVVPLEPCELREVPELSCRAQLLLMGTGLDDNILIQGDNLQALAVLEAEYGGKVKLIYIDPPYNTGKEFEHYDDGITHNRWLNMMRDRLLRLRPLLQDDGIIAVQIGVNEMAYLKVLMDEIYGRSNCIGQVAVRMSHSAGMKRIVKDRRLIKNTEYILFYYKETQPVLYPLYEKVTEFPVNYFYWISEFPHDGKPGKYISLTDILKEKFLPLFSKYGLKVQNNNINTVFHREEALQQFLIANRDRVARKHAEVPSLKDDFSHLTPHEFVRVDTDTRSYFMGCKNAVLFQLIPLTEKVQSVSYVDEDGHVAQEYVLANLLGDWWDGFWRDMSRVDVEGGVLMKESKKPERLLQWILDLTTRPGDLVLDSFLGSGTTAAVAQKMGRHWIGVECGDHCETLAAERLRHVVAGEDPTGITRAVGWQGGGGFKYYRLVKTNAES